MKNVKKRGFTLVELVIVIAVVAILVAVLIPTFGNLINKANMSSDQVALRDMNNILAMMDVETDNPTYNDVLEEFRKNGFDVEDYKPLTEGTSFYWVPETNKIVLYDDETNKIVYPENSKDNLIKDDTWVSLHKKVEDNQSILNNVKVGDKVTFADQTWTVVANEEDTLFVTSTFLPNSGVAFDDSYADGLHDYFMSIMYDKMSDSDKEKIALSTIGGFNTTNGIYDENGKDTLKRYIFTLSLDEVMQLPESDRIAENEYQRDLWMYPRQFAEGTSYVTRTMSETMMDSGGYHKFYLVGDDGTCPIEIWGNVCNYRPSLRLIKSEFTTVKVSDWDINGSKLYELDGSKGNAKSKYLGEPTNVFINLQCDEPLFINLIGSNLIEEIGLTQGQKLCDLFRNFGALAVPLEGNNTLIDSLIEKNPGMTFDDENEFMICIEMNESWLYVVASLSYSNELISPNEIITSDISGKTLVMNLRVVNYSFY